MRKKLIIFPFGGNGREAAAQITSSAALKEEWELVGFVDDDPAARGKEACGVTVLGNTNILKEYPEAKILAVPGNPGNYLKRRDVIEGLDLKKDRFARVLAPSAVISPDAKIGYNTLLLANVVVGCGATIGNHCIILPNTTLGHDSVIEDYCCIGANVAVSGYVTIRSGCYIGSGSAIRERVTIRERALVGIGSNVISDIEKEVIVAGNPAKLLRH
ncbi:MAG: hypothetical protein A3C36_01935 [Omnitrophica WOR_2 bacterium RIFCSPHIGHO2_02_FULL_52_10]|nr:MAG: hypothetical protein A3C36_01935 [Omnitrophica WOR_2 bacterium RIFCSPHIGHO2_02_FULL_52_10]